MDPALFSTLQQNQGHLDEIASLVVAYGFGVAAPILIAAVALTAARRWRARARQEQRSRGPGGKLEAGTATLSGKVELAASEPRAVRVEIQQRSQTLSRTETLWLETSRLVEVHPFYLRLASGARVRVEPPPTVRYLDKLDGLSALDEDGLRRLRFAELAAGEEVFIHGELTPGVDPEQPGYRQGGEALVLRPAHDGRMRISSQRPGCDFERRARARVSTARLALILALVANLLMLPYHARRFTGSDERGTVTELTKTRGRRGTTYHAKAMVKGRTISDDLKRERWSRLNVGAAVPVRLVERLLWTSAIGWGATLWNAHVVFVGLMVLASISTYLGKARAARSWPDRRRFSEKEKHAPRT